MKTVRNSVFIIIIIGFIKIIYSQSEATPPPISTLNFHSGSGAWKNTIMYLQVGKSIASYGNFFQYSRALSDRRGFSLLLLGMNMSYQVPNFDMQFHEDYYYTSTTWTEWNNIFLYMIGANLIQEIVGGEKKDIAGEIVSRGLSLSIFGGGYLMGMKYLGNIGIGQAGIVAEVPIFWMFSIVPYSYFNYFFNDNSAIAPTYGWDILITPFRNARDWKISLGASIAQIEGNKDQNRTIMIGILHEWGKFYKGTTITPH